MAFYAGKKEQDCGIFWPACSLHWAPHCLPVKSSCISCISCPHWHCSSVSVLVVTPNCNISTCIHGTYTWNCSGQWQIAFRRSKILLCSGVSFGNSAALGRALKDGAGNLLIINFLTRFLAIFMSCPSWKCHENIFSWSILSLSVSFSKWENIYSNIREAEKTV